MSGQLLNGRKVWELHATHGLPLEVSLMELGRRGIMVTWLDLLEAASRDGTAWTTLVPRLKFAVKEAYPADDADVINARLDNIMRSVAA